MTRLTKERLDEIRKQAELGCTHGPNTMLELFAEIDALRIEKDDSDSSWWEAINNNSMLHKTLAELWTVYKREIKATDEISGVLLTTQKERDALKRELETEHDFTKTLSAQYEQLETLKDETDSMRWNSIKNNIMLDIDNKKLQERVKELRHTLEHIDSVLPECFYCKHPEDQARHYENLAHEALDADSLHEKRDEYV